MNLLDETTVVAYLKEREIFSPNSHPNVEILTGGISNVVLAVTGEGKDLVLKQSLPQLRVKGTWLADQRRTLVEARAIEVLHAITPEHVPKLYDVDSERFTLILERAPKSASVWKEDLLNGVIHPEVAAELGSILGQWHKATSSNSAILDEFREDLLFEQQRIDPFYRTLAGKHKDIADRIETLIMDLERSQTSLVHGDFSPKNVLVKKDGHTIVLDFEVAHTGNPVFDIAFLLGHLICKQEYFVDQEKKKAITSTAMAFIGHYETRYRSPVAPTLAWHAATIALARVDGLSPVNYLAITAQESLRGRMLAILRNNAPLSISEIF